MISIPGVIAAVALTGGMVTSYVVLKTDVATVVTQVAADEDRNKERFENIKDDTKEIKEGMKEQRKLLDELLRQNDGG